MRLIDADELKKIIKENDALTMTGFSVRLCDINSAPTIQAVPIDTLDKIRAEIMSKDGLEEALEIIDKYREESE